MKYETFKSDPVAVYLGIAVFLSAGAFFIHYGVNAFFEEIFIAKDKWKVVVATDPYAKVGGVVFAAIGLFLC